MNNLQSINEASMFLPHLEHIPARAEALLPTLRAWCEQNSGTFNAAGVDAVGESIVCLFASLQPDIQPFSVLPYQSLNAQGQVESRPLGQGYRLQKRPQAPLQILLVGHLDTVYPASSLFQKTRIDGDFLHGPGVADLKGGLLVLFLALEALEASPWAENLGWQVVFNPDEEIGSQGSMPFLKQAAQGSHLALIYEPAYANGGLASTRKGSGNFEILVKGRAAHAGRDFHQGRNAIRMAADWLTELDQLNGQRGDLTLNLGFVSGGGALNVVPDTAVLKFNVRTEAAEDEAWLQAHLQRLQNQMNRREGFHCEILGGFTRPPKALSAGLSRLMSYVSDCAQKLDFSVSFTPTGGCCDGNNLAAFGLPNLDNMGVVGADIHSEQERMRLSSLPERAKLSALLLMRLASGDLIWPTC
jgi:glutamate carboxypeptidase